MRDLRGIVRTSLSFQFGDKVTVRAVVAGRYHDERVNLLSSEIGGTDHIHRIDEHIDTLVPIFVTSADSDKDSIL